jgi:radical SAM superfamily enzyme YgiQ (UPF0313 family)
MKVLLVSAWHDRFQGDERSREFPSLSAIHLAALCPPGVEVSVVHEQVRPLDPETCDADLVAITATTGAAVRMYELADRLRARGHAVVLGGPHVSLLPEEALAHADAVAAGYAERSFPLMIRDFEQGKLGGVYTQPDGIPLDDLPVPRYDLLEDAFHFRCFVQATRGCPFQCSFCALKGIDPGFRTRPVEHVIRDIQRCEGKTWLQRKMVWFWDDNLTGSPAYARELFTRLKPLKKWWWTQASIDLAQDPELLRMASESGCLAVFVGLESFSAANLLQVRKRHNKVEEYRRAVKAFHDAGIAVQAGVIVGLDEDTPETLRKVPDAIQEIGIDLAFLNVLTPFPATGLRAELGRQGRLLDRPWSVHDSAHVAYAPARMSPHELEALYWEIYRDHFSPRRTLRRFVNAVRSSKLPALLLDGYVDALITTQNLFRPDRHFEDALLPCAPPSPSSPATP